MTTFTYTGVTPEEMTAMRAKLIAGGAQITASVAAPNQFRVTGHGITSNATYDPATKTLTVAVVSKPWIIPASAIDEGIKEALTTA
jgi:hypothetical protein